ncbi:MAG: GNAT family N-acetyltransferase [Proteobacteria bacterium]|nr:GNAT family N-acetyltransferase [Pseudomonadota bacterium]
MPTIIETDRLLLRTWKKEDADSYWRINQDTKVLEFLMGPLTMEQVREFMTQCNAGIAEHKFGLFAVEVKESGEMIGFIGLNIPRFEAHFTPAVEIGWRLASDSWGKGYATEGAKACLEYGFNVVALKEIVSFTVPSNTRSRRVMEKIGMRQDLAGDFAHPNLPLDHPLSRHILYIIKNNDN